jgi:hypothetical protein
MQSTENPNMCVSFCLLSFGSRNNTSFGKAAGKGVEKSPVRIAAADLGRKSLVTLVYVTDELHGALLAPNKLASLTANVAGNSIPDHLGKHSMSGKWNKVQS